MRLTLLFSGRFVQILFAAILIATVGTGQLQAQRANERFEARWWPTPLKGEDYPEMHFDSIGIARDSFGVAFHGGGNRAAPATLGQIRALIDANWMPKVRYISAISGGSWTAVPWTYLKATCDEVAVNCNEKRFLGKTLPTEIIAKRLAQIVANKKEECSDIEDSSMLGAMCDALITKRVIKAYLSRRFDESFAQALGEIYLAPFGLGRKTQSEPNSLFTWTKTDANRLSGINRFSGVPVHYVERPRPYLIVGGSLLTRRSYIKADDKFRMEMTPLYTGMPIRMQYSKKNARHGFEARLAGGGFVESAGYDYITRSIENRAGQTVLSLEGPKIGNQSNQHRLNFSLSDVIAVSGAAPVEQAVSLPVLSGLARNFGFPEIHVPVDQVTAPEPDYLMNDGQLGAKEWAHGDGGHEDNLGIAPLLARQVENILSFTNVYAPFRNAKRLECDQKVREMDQSVPLKKDSKTVIVIPKACMQMIGSDIPSFFFPTKDHIHNAGLRLLGSTTRMKRPELQPLADLLTVAKDIMSGDNLSCQRYIWQPQFTPSLFGQARTAYQEAVSYQPTICFSWLGRDDRWMQEVEGALARQGVPESKMDEVRARLDMRSACSLGRDFEPAALGGNCFPHLGTFRDKRGYIIQTLPSRLFALSQFTSWQFNQNQEQIRAAFKERGLNLP